MLALRTFPSATELVTSTVILLTLTLGSLRAHATTDTTPPVISGLPANVTVECSAIPAAASPTATDDTDPNPTIALQETSTQAASGCGKYSYTLTRTWTATDASANSSSASQVITVTDTTAPVINYIPANTTVECSAVPAPPTAVANCAANTTPPQLRLSDGTPAGTIVITDQDLNDISAVAGQITFAGAVGSWSINITTALTAPAPGGGSSIQPTMVLNTLNVGSGQLTIEFSANGFCATGVMQAQVAGLSGGNIQFKTWIDTGNTNFGRRTLVGNLGPFATGSFSSNTVTTISPALPYSMTMQTVITHLTSAVSQFSSQVGVFVPMATDNCDTSPTLTFGETSTQTPIGPGHDNYTITRTWTASDACGNTSSAQQTLVVHDTTAPVITGVPTSATVQCNAVPAPATPTVTDNCDASPSISLAVASTQALSGCGQFNYTISRTWTATDASGNSSTTNQVVTVVDTTAPVLSAAPADVTVQCDAVPGAAILTATDNCDPNPGVTLTAASTQTISGCGQFNYTLTRTWTATDACGNSSTAQQVVVVHDTAAPALAAAPADITVQCDAVPSAATLTATDNCDANPAVTYAQTSVPSCSGSYVQTRTWTATDAYGNSTSQVQHVTVSDTTAPVLIGVPATLTVQCDAVPAAPSPTATDNCDTSPTITLSQTTTPGSCSGNYVMTRTWTASDACGNTSTASQQITVADTTSPVLVGVPSDVTVDCNALPAPANVTAADNCDTNASVAMVTFSTQTPTGPGHDTYILKRKWTATDSCGNSATAQQFLTVAPIAPVITAFPADVTYSCSSEVPAPDDNLISGTDPCGGNVLYIYHDGDVITDVACANQYNIARAYHVTNVCGIITSRTQHISVHDATPPVITAFPADTTLDCLCDLPAANDALITASDNCSAITVTHTADVTNNIVDALHFDIQRTYIASDVCGNQISHTQTFHMSLFNPPFITITGAPSIVVSAASYVLHGTAGNTFPLVGVHYSLNGAPYQLAIGTTNWSATLHLVPGTNTLAAYVIDNHSTVSTTAVATLFYHVGSKLIVQIRGWPEPNQIDPHAGVITPNLNGQTLEVGVNYTMTAVASPAHRFVGWAYSASLAVSPFDTNATLTFTMQPNLKLIARFENPYYHLGGTWSGLFSEPTPDPRSAGFISIALPFKPTYSNVAYYSGRVLLDGTNYTFNYPNAKFNTSGHTHLVLPRTGKSPLTIDMDIDVITYTGTITGTITTPEWTANLVAHRGWTNVGNAEFRRYTMALPPVSGPAPSPAGWGVAATTNGPGGAVHVIGFAADGAQIIAQTTYVSENLEFPFYGQLYGNATTGYKGSIWGWLNFSKNQPGVTGNLYWWHPAGVTNGGYAAGFSNITQIVGSPYTNFPSGTPELGWTGAATVSLYDNANLALTSAATTDNNNKITIATPNTNTIKLTITPLNGLITGSFGEPLLHKIDPPIHGVILQNIRTNLGFYTSTNGGAFLFTPN